MSTTCQVSVFRMMMFSWPSKQGTQLSEPIVLVVTTFMLIITIIFYGLASSDNSENYGFDLDLEVFYRGHKHGNTTKGYPLQISPPMWGYAVAIIFMFIWQCTWLLYGWSFLFRPRVPKVIPMASYLLFSAAMGLIIVRLYVYANRHVNPGLVCQILVTALLIGCLGLAHFLMYWRTSRLQQEGWVMDKWITRFVVHNGLALMVTWQIIELLLYINITMQYNSGKTVKADVASSIIIVSYLVFLTLWVILETTVLDQFMRYTVTIYPVCLWFLSTALIEQWDHKRYKQTRNNNLLVGALCYTATVQVSRIAFLIFFRISRPLDWPQPRPQSGGYRRVQFQY